MPVKTRPQKRTERDLLRVATFILFDAAVYHEGLAGTIPTIASLRRATSPTQGFLVEQWDRILAIDYEPVFGLAREVLDAFPTSPDTEAILRRILDTAINVVASGVLLRHDFMGRAYHKLLLRTTAHFYASYYTSIPAAWLLANLTIKTTHPNWNLNDLNAIGRFRLIDPACGSGTLLSASYMAIKDRYILSRPATLDLNALHKLLVEQVVHGWDILDYASHLTLTTLSLHSNRARVRSSNILTLPSGVDQNGVHLGSLSVLSFGRAIVGKGFTTPAVRHGIEGSRDREINPADELDKYDVVIMNPPFSRSAKPNRKFGYSTPDVQKRMGLALHDLTEEIGARGIGHAGLGAYFMILGLRLAKADGRIAVVIPRALLSGVSWTRIRRDYLRDCEIEYIVSNFDPGSPSEGIEPWNWSENTSLGEILVIARKTDTPVQERSTTYVNLWRKPRNEVEALLVSHQVARGRGSLTGSLDHGEWRPITRREQTVGCFYRIPQSLMERNWLSPCLFADPTLNSLGLECFKPAMPCVPLGRLTTQLGVDIKQVKDHFAQTDHRTTYPMVWGHQSVMNTVRLAVEHVGWGRVKRKGSAALHGRGASDLIIAERPHLSTEALLAMHSPSAVLTTAFWEVRPSNKEYALPILLWLNSTYGVLQYLACATSSMGDIFKLKKDQLEGVPIIDPARMNSQDLEQIWCQISKQQFAPFSQEFDRAANGAGPRYMLDNFFQQRANLPAITVEHYRLLSKDPVITKTRL